MGRVVLVHGAWHGAWCWEQVVDELSRRGVSSTAVELPLTGYEEDVATARSAISSAGEEAVVCAHSYGGLVVSQAASGLPGVKRLVFVSAFQSEEGEDMVSILSTDPTPLLSAIVFEAEGVSVDPARVREVFYGDSDPSVAQAAQARLRPMQVADTPVMAGVPAWKTIPSTYVVCTRDRAIAPSVQRKLASRADEVVEWESDHSPFLTRPADIADLLASYS